MTVASGCSLCRRTSLSWLKSWYQRLRAHVKPVWISFQSPLWAHINHTTALWKSCGIHVNCEGHRYNPYAESLCRIIVQNHTVIIAYRFFTHCFTHCILLAFCILQLYLHLHASLCNPNIGLSWILDYPGLLEELDHYGLLGVEPVLCFLEDLVCVSLEDFVRNLLAAVSGKAVHYHYILLRAADVV